MNTKHTKGKWVLAPTHLDRPTLAGFQKCYIRVGDKKATKFVAIVPAYHKEEMKANAKLIASAPDLLNCLRQARKRIMESEPIVKIIDEVIKKAIE